MDIRPIELRKELMQSYREVNALLEPLRNTENRVNLIPLVVARVQILHALTLLNEKK